MTSFNLDPETLSALVQKAVLDMITPENRDELIEGAIKHLMTTPTRTNQFSGAPTRSPLTEAFEGAVHAAAVKYVREAIEADPKVAEAIRAVVHPLVADLCADNYDGLPQAIGDAFGTWLQERRR